MLKKTLIKYHNNGRKKEQATYVDGIKDGVTTIWHSNGEKKIEVNYSDGKKNGTMTWFDINGKRDLFDQM